MSESLFGVLCMHKPDGMTSRDVVNVVQRLVRPAKCGHAGTLDPMATGVLLVCIGPATRLISLLQGTAKTYETEFLLGQRSDTDDVTGKIDRTLPEPSAPALSEVSTMLSSMTGIVQQVPPAFSAVHIHGQRAYTLARKGENVSIAPRDVRIDQIEVLAYDWPRLNLRIRCGSGTYIRSIARDLGERLGCGGLMSRLVRTQVGRFQLSDAVSLETISREVIVEHMHPPTLITADLPQYRCSETDREQLTCGKTISVDPCRLFCGTPEVRDSSASDLPGVVRPVAMCSEADGQLWALAELSRSGQQLQPRLVFIKPPSNSGHQL